MYVPNTRKVVAVQDVNIKESEVGLIPDNTALDEQSTVTRERERNSESLEDSEPEDCSQTVGFFEKALGQAEREEPRLGTRARNFPQVFGEVSTHLVVIEGDYVEPKTVYEAKHGGDWDQ